MEREVEVEVEHRTDNDEQHVNAKMAVERVCRHSAGYANSQTTVALSQLTAVPVPVPATLPHLTLLRGRHLGFLGNYHTDWDSDCNTNWYEVGQHIDLIIPLGLITA